MMAREATVCAAIAPKRKKVKKKKARAPSFCPNTSNSWSFSRNFSGKLRATVILLGLLGLLGVDSSTGLLGPLRECRRRRPRFSSPVLLHIDSHLGRIRARYT